MRDAHHAHVRAATHATLLHRVGRGIEDVHERHGTAGDAVRSADHRTARTELLKSEAGTAASLMNDSGVGRRLHDAGDRIRDIEHKARSKLSVWLTGVDEARRVRHE